MSNQDKAQALRDALSIDETTRVLATMTANDVNGLGTVPLLESVGLSAEHFYLRILGRRYWFSGPYNQMTPVCCIALRSSGGESWAAYIAGVDTYAPEDDAMASNVARYGAKLDETTARAMFPDVELRYRA